MTHLLIFAFATHFLMFYEDQTGPDFPSQYFDNGLMSSKNDSHTTNWPFSSYFLAKCVYYFLLLNNAFQDTCKYSTLLCITLVFLSVSLEMNIRKCRRISTRNFMFLYRMICLFNNIYGYAILFGVFDNLLFFALSFVSRWSFSSIWFSIYIGSTICHRIVVYILGALFNIQVTFTNCNNLIIRLLSIYIVL